MGAGVPIYMFIILLEFLWLSEAGMAGRKTAIGDAIAVAANQLKDLKTNTKIIILLTDGDNNSGRIQPLEAANAAAAYGIRIYTIGMGSRRDIDEPLLKKIAKDTNGRYFQASNTQSLSEVYQVIDQLEKTEIETPQWIVREELFDFWILLAIGALFAELIFLTTRFRGLP